MGLSIFAGQGARHIRHAINLSWLVTSTRTPAFPTTSDTTSVPPLCSLLCVPFAALISLGGKSTRLSEMNAFVMFSSLL